MEEIRALERKNNSFAKQIKKIKLEIEKKLELNPNCADLQPTINSSSNDGIDSLYDEIFDDLILFKEDHFKLCSNSLELFTKEIDKFKKSIKSSPPITIKRIKLASNSFKNNSFFNNSINISNNLNCLNRTCNYDNDLKFDTISFKLTNNNDTFLADHINDSVKLDQKTSNKKKLNQKRIVDKSKLNLNETFISSNNDQINDLKSSKINNQLNETFISSKNDQINDLKSLKINNQLNETFVRSNNDQINEEKSLKINNQLNETFVQSNNGQKNDVESLKINNQLNETFVRSNNDQINDLKSLKINNQLNETILIKSSTKLDQIFDQNMKQNFAEDLRLNFEEDLRLNFEEDLRQNLEEDSEIDDDKSSDNIIKFKLITEDNLEFDISSPCKSIDKTKSTSSTAIKTRSKTAIKTNTTTKTEFDTLIETKAKTTIKTKAKRTVNKSSSTATKLSSTATKLTTNKASTSKLSSKSSNDTTITKLAKKSTVKKANGKKESTISNDKLMNNDITINNTLLNVDIIGDTFELSTSKYNLRRSVRLSKKNYCC